jgi:type IV pilus assembly protein PilA
LKKTARGFTLVELLVVIAIIAILAAVVVLIINPLELMKRSRDAARLTDLANLQTAINVAVQESTQSSQYIACNTVAGDCTDKSTNNVTGYRGIDGNGWVKINFANQKSVSVPTLPIDPINSTAYHYTYCGNGETWRIETVLESDQQKPKMLADGGLSDTMYEVGSDMTTAVIATCTY